MHGTLSCLPTSCTSSVPPLIKLTDSNVTPRLQIESSNCCQYSLLPPCGITFHYSASGFIVPIQALVKSFLLLSAAFWPPVACRLMGSRDTSHGESDARKLPRSQNFLTSDS